MFDFRKIPDELDLVDLEQQLIARSLLFIKAKKLLRAQLRAMKDKVINVPLKNDYVTKKLSVIPRHPDDAHFVALQLKRKVDMKNSELEGSFDQT